MMSKGNFFLLVIIGCLLASLFLLRRQNADREAELLTRIENVKAEYAPMIRTAIRDTVSVAEHAAYTANHSDVKEKLRDKHILTDIGLKASQLNSVQTTSLQTSLDVTLSEQRGIEATDSVVIPRTWSYHDEWTDVVISDTTLHVAVKDSIATFVYREYKHRFLWWRWGTKSIRVKLVNFNPHSTIKYDQYIKVED